MEKLNLTREQLKVLELAFAIHAAATRTLWEQGEWDEETHKDQEKRRDEALAELGLPGLDDMFKKAYYQD